MSRREGAAWRGARLRRLGLALALSLAATVAAAEAIAVEGTLSDEDFYRLVSCAAPPGEACAADPLRWATDRPIRVALRRIDPAYLGRRKIRAEAALTQALRELNAAQAGFRLTRVGANDPAEIELFFLGLAAGGPIAGTGTPGVDGTTIGETSTALAVDRSSATIRGATIAVSTSLATEAYEGAILKQLTRAMGLTTEIAAEAYAASSALAHASNRATQLGAQDIAALRRHYSPQTR